ncbi:Membrane proteinase PrsW, cleaves anti-sigma factor RsiW, M82 family [Halobiforma haloterrestris]|uniref:Membrane proteinase PrsW, cleaves anti-sigma factor RsiW, M82 family n=1 Tax=Natronobacterium haloterrestre TaxID=148448 RepID=A0A1I1DZQ3_NATHA|nr:PrsW family intramembrane metalloprotease [Halobiforma haloterrestris]SFB80304.1 Membrane proteinase PrsW, cleaves anti-sigma factor RsiW, M82 family [Halobiforma haloterrestris]
MERRRDPVERADDGSSDLYDVSTWEPRSTVDLLAYALYNGVSYGLQTIVLLVAAVITLALLVQPAVLVLEDPLLGAFFGLSIVPAALLAAFIWRTDITSEEPLTLLVATFVLAILFATFAALINSVMRPRFQTLSLIGPVLFFYLIVGPVEEAVKLLAVRVFAYRSDTFDAVVDGAVYGAVAGLGFAAIENAIYISGTVAEAEAGLFAAATGITTVRALAGPGHVIYSAIAGYYLGLAKFNPQHAGPIVAKGLLVAAFVHATYNTTVGIVPGIAAELTALGPDAALVSYMIVFDAAVGYYLYRKIARYRRRYRDAEADVPDSPSPELTEFDPPRRRRWER